jgi:hypothetical protein
VNYQCDVVVFNDVAKSFEFSADDDGKAVKLVTSLVDVITKFAEMTSISLKCRELTFRDCLPDGVRRLEMRHVFRWDGSDSLTFGEAIESFNEYFHTPS